MPNMINTQGKRVVGKTSIKYIYYTESEAFKRGIKMFDQAIKGEENNY